MKTGLEPEEEVGSSPASSTVCQAMGEPSPDGRRLAIGNMIPPRLGDGCFGQRPITDAPMTGYDLFLMDLATGRATRLPTPASFFDGDWSADGKTLFTHYTAIYYL